RDLLSRTVFDALVGARRWAEELFGRLNRRLDGGDPVLRLTDAFKEDRVWPEGLDVALDNLLIAFSKLRDGVETIADRLSIDDPAEMRTRLIGELRGVVRRLDTAADGLKETLQPKRPSGGPSVRWMERRGRRTPNLTLSAVPLDLAPILKETLFDRTETVILTSATLAAGGEFTFLEERLGLSLAPSRVTVREVLPSPFDFGAQCVFGIPTRGRRDSRTRRRALAVARAGRGAARSAAASLPRSGLGDSARNGFILGRRGRAGPRAARADSRQAAVQSADGAANRRAPGASDASGRGRLHELSRPARGAQVETGIWAADPDQVRRGRRRAAGSTSRDQALWSHDARGPAAGDQGDRQLA